MKRLALSLLVSSLLVACGRESQKTAPVVAQEEAAKLDLSLEARTQAAIDAVTERFKATVQEKYLENGMTVRGLVRQAMLPKSKQALELQPAKFDPAASAAAKLELVNGKVIYTATAAPEDPHAAVLSDGHEAYSVGYVVEAEVAPAGELRAISVRQVTEPRRVN